MKSGKEVGQPIADSCKEKINNVIGTEKERKAMKKLFKNMSLEKYLKKYWDILATLKTKSSHEVREKIKMLKVKKPYRLQLALRLKKKLAAVGLHGTDYSFVDIRKVLQAVRALKKLLKKEDDVSSVNPIYMQISCVRIPITNPRQFLISLPHPLLPKSDVCLITKDWKKRGKPMDFDTTAVHYRKLLNKYGVSRISEIITLRQLKREYEVYEMKRALFSRFDFFLVDKSISGHAAHFLGRDINRRKTAVPVSLASRHLKQHINAALQTTSFNLHPNGSTFSFKVGFRDLPAAKLSRNIVAACKSLRKRFPGGWDNISSVRIKSSKSMAIPVHVSGDLLDWGAYPHVLKPRGYQNEVLFGVMDQTPIQVDADGYCKASNTMEELLKEKPQLEKMGYKVITDQKEIERYNEENGGEEVDGEEEDDDCKRMRV